MKKKKKMNFPSIQSNNEFNMGSLENKNDDNNIVKKYKFYINTFTDDEKINEEIPIEKHIKNVIDDLLLSTLGIDYLIYGPPITVKKFIDCVLEYIALFLLSLTESKEQKIYSYDRGRPNNNNGNGNNDSDTKNKTIGVTIEELNIIEVDPNIINLNQIDYLIISAFMYVWGLFAFDEDYGSLSTYNFAFLRDSMISPNDSERVKENKQMLQAEQSKMLQQYNATLTNLIFTTEIPIPCRLLNLSLPLPLPKMKTKNDGGTTVGETIRSVVQYLMNILILSPSQGKQKALIISKPYDIINNSNDNDNLVNQSIESIKKDFDSKDKKYNQYIACVVAIVEYLIIRYHLESYDIATVTVATILWVWKRLGYDHKYFVEPDINKFIRVCNCSQIDIENWIKIIEEENLILYHVLPQDQTKLEKFQKILLPCSNFQF
jgi:hypothetical protein